MAYKGQHREGKHTVKGQERRKPTVTSLSKETTRVIKIKKDK